MSTIKKFISIAAFTLALTFSLFVLPSSSFASEQSATGFSYLLEYPENQMEDVGYYKLRMTPGQSQTVKISLSNASSEDITINVSLSGVKTNSNGVLEYGPTEIENDASLKFPFEEVVTAPEKVTIKAGETTELELQIKMPETSFDGLIVGGIYMIRDDSADEAAANDGSTVVNKYAYAVAMVLSETDSELTSELKLNTVYADQENYRNAIFVNYSNVVADYVNNMATEVQITKKGSENVLYETKKTEMRMAPNSMINFPVSMNGEQMIAGEYTAHILVGSGGQRWEWTEDFEITQEEADKFNERDVGLVQEKGIDWQLVAMIVGGVLLVIILLFIAIRTVRKRKEQRLQEEKRQRKAKINRKKAKK